MSSRLRVLLCFLPLVLAMEARAQEDGLEAPLREDPVLMQLIDESLAAMPELKQSQALARAERERVEQGGALPDPTLSIGVQNDGFRSWQIGKMETSWYELMLTQGLPWPGKRGLRSAVAALGARQSEALIARMKLRTEADVRRAYLDMLVARDRLSLLDQLDSVWQKSAAVARSRYETGEGPQSDVLRAQLEINRLRHRRWALSAEVLLRKQLLNRMRGKALDAPLETETGVRDLALPVAADLARATAAAVKHSPELAAARLGVSRADRQMDLARRDRFPDFSVSAGVMPRGGLEPMWRASVAVGLPVWASRKQLRSVAESEARRGAETHTVTALEQLLALRVSERRIALSTLLETIELYREGLLVQSRATAESTLAQYRVGKVTFASVLDANVGYLNDEEAYLLALADAQRIAIASAEITLDPVGTSVHGAVGSSAVPGAGAMGASPPGAGMSGGAASTPASAPEGSGSSSAAGM